MIRCHVDCPSGLLEHPLASRLLLAVLWCAGTVSPLGARTPLNYPETRRVEQKDDYHGTMVDDPYRWLEVDVRESNDVANWVEQQNELTFRFLEAIPQRAAIQRRLTELWNYAKYSSAFKAGPYYFYSRNDGLQNQSVLHVSEGLEGKPRVLLDPNTWSKDGTVALAGLSPSDDGRYLAFGRAEAGSDWQTWLVMDVRDGKPLSDKLEWVKFSGVSWTNDNAGFYYSRYDQPKPGAEFQSLNLNQKVFYHQLGTPQSEDRLIYARPDHPEWGFNATVSQDGHYLVITVWKGTDEKYLVYYLDRTDPQAEPRELIGEFQHEYSFIDNLGSEFLFKTNDGAPRGRVIAIPVDRPQRSDWREVIPESAETLVGVSLVGDRFFANYLKDARSLVQLYALDGRLERELALPGLGTAAGFDGKRKDQEAFYSFTSITTAPTIFRYDIPSAQSHVFRRDDVRADLDRYEVQQVFYPGKDGTRIPMFVAHAKDVKRDGAHPTLLYGYGGFNVPLTPTFSISRLVWMEMGGVFAMPNLRGGGEYGESWHEAGKLKNKQNVFNDFIAAAEWLIANQYTRPDRLAIQGRSNGGLLVGACLTQRPDLFGACLPGVGVMDMLRFHKFTAGRFWVDEYGSADDANQFAFLKEYSPYHHIRNGVKYPATLVTTADTDDRVVPGHSFKFAAALQHAQAGDAPTLIRIETRAGHGAGKPTEKIIEEVADELAFLVATLNFQPTLPSAKD